MTIDDRVTAWLLDRLRAGDRVGRMDPHLISCPTSTVTVRDTAWECDCLSEYTRDDTFYLFARVSCGCGVSARWRYGSWRDFPGFFDELDAYRDVPAHSWDDE